MSAPVPAANPSSAAISPDSSSPSSFPLSPAQRYHPGHFSPALSFLDRRDFAAAVRVCHSWHAAGYLPSAWPPPTFDVVANLSSMRDPSSLRHRLEEPLLGASRLLSLTLQSQSSSWLNADSFVRAGGSSVWLQASEAQIALATPPPSNHSAPTVTDVVLDRVGQMGRLTALSMHQPPDGSTAMQRCFTSLAPRLLLLTSVGVSQSLLAALPALRQLRVLSLRITPDCKVSNLEALQQLHQLEYLRITTRSPQQLTSLCVAVRFLSGRHRLWGLELTCGAESMTRAGSRNLFTALIDKHSSGLPPSKLTSLYLDAPTSVLPRLRPLLSLPHLTSLQLCEERVDQLEAALTHWRPLIPAEQHTLARLQTLHFASKQLDEKVVNRLRLFPYLQALQLTLDDEDRSAEEMSEACGAMAAALPNMETLGLICPRFLPLSSSIPAVATLYQLRTLSLEFRSSFSPSSLLPLAQLPHLHTFIVRVFFTRSLSVGWEQLRPLAVSSPSLHCIRLSYFTTAKDHILFDWMDEQLLGPAGGVTEEEGKRLQHRSFRLQLQPLFLARPTEREYGLVTHPSGGVLWRLC